MTVMFSSPVSFLFQTILNTTTQLLCLNNLSLRSPREITFRKHTAWHMPSTLPINVSFPSIFLLENLQRSFAAYRIKCVFHWLSHLFLISSNLVFILFSRTLFHALYATVKLNHLPVDSYVCTLHCSLLPEIS